jgi:hypothetical protein
MKKKLQPNLDVIRLYDENSPPPPVTKIGILPFLAAPDWRVMLMKPHAEAKHLGEPAFQIAKGTRRIHINDGWCDMREEDLHYADECFWEPLLATALREGEEEIGLKAGNIRKVYDMGGFTFISASRKVVKPLHMFAAELDNPHDFLPFEATTSEAKWMTLEEFTPIGRPDHVTIVAEVLGRLKGAYRL